MKKKNRGFTLIELMIAIAVLSIMGGVLFQVFAVSGKLGLKARKSEVVQDIAKRTMEELKGYSFETLDQMAAEERSGETPDIVEIAGTTYSYEPLPKTEDDKERYGYLLKTTYGVAAEDPDKVKYLICAEADRGIYSDASDGAKDNVYSINQYQMPNIVDVSSSRNIVLEPQMIVKDQDTDSEAEGENPVILGDALRVAKLLNKVNPESSDEGAEEDTQTYDEEDISKYIHLNLVEKTVDKAEDGRDVGRLLAETSVIYTVDSEDIFSSDGFDPEYSITFPLTSFNKKILKDEKTGNPSNRVYIFLPETENAKFEKLFVSTDIVSTFELYVIAADGYKSETADQYISIKTNDRESGGIELYTNLRGVNQLVSNYPEKDRLYYLTVTVYEADYSGGRTDLKPGKKLLELESSKSE